MRWTLLVAALPALSVAQIGGPGTYPQFRSLSGLPGSGFGVAADGQPSGRGAWSLSTPIAYSIKPWHFVFGAGSMSPNLTPRFLDSSAKESTSNGTAQFMVGLPLGRFGTASYTVMVLSTRLDNVGNFQWTPPNQRGPITFGLGVQDVSGSGGTQGEGPNGKDPGNSRSYFAVGTYNAGGGTYASLGVGSNRFNSVFGNVSTPLGDRFKAVAEYDAFNWNFGLGYDLGSVGKGPIRDRDMGVSLFLGVVRGRYATWAVNVRF